MNDDEVDRMLSRDDEILASSGFVSRVMESVRQEALVPPPIPFPWKRVVPGLAIAGLALMTLLIALAVTTVRYAGAMTARVSGPFSGPFSMPSSLFHGGIESAVTWTALALAAALLSVKLSMGFASSSV